jgi:hypothetical protein
MKLPAAPKRDFRFVLISSGVLRRRRIKKMKHIENPYKVIADKKKNRLYVDLFLTDEEQAEKIVDEIWAKAKQLTVGWGCVVNFTKADVPLTEKMLDIIETVMSFLKQLGMGQLVRVLSKKQSSFNCELKNRSMKIGGYEGIVTRTVQDADAIIDLTRD